MMTVDKQLKWITLDTSFNEIKFDYLELHLGRPPTPPQCTCDGCPSIASVNGVCVSFLVHSHKDMSDRSLVKLNAKDETPTEPEERKARDRDH